MKNRVVVFGLGKDFKHYMQLVLEEFEVIACTDNRIIPRDDFWKKCFIFPEELQKVDFDKVLICSRKFRDTIGVQLIKMGIPLKKIVFLESFIDNSYKVDFNDLIQDIETYNSLNSDARFSITEESLYLISEDKYSNAGIPIQHYFAQDIWGGNKIYLNNPQYHYDIASRLDGFIAHLLVFREVNYIDIRPLPYNIPNLHFVQSDATTLKEIEDETIESLSCFHALEHFGLGRYGDTIDPNAYIKAAQNMQRVLTKEGHLYIGVPVGPEDKLVFNAHRIFKIPTIVELFSRLDVCDVRIIEPDGFYAKKINIDESQNIKEYSCGLFEFIKKY